MKRVADIVVETLIENGIDVCFSVVGGGAMHLNNAFIEKKDKIKTIYNHHEQACSMAAEGYARLSGKIAAVCVTSGPGGTNAINGVQGAWVDSVPMIVISGAPRMDTTVAATGLDIRTRGVQENNIIEQVKYITKYAVQINDATKAKYEVEKAIDIAMDGRRGPVWLEIPLDIQGALTDEYFDQIISFEKEKADAGLFMSDFACQNIIDQCNAFIADSDNHYLIETFNTRIDKLTGLTQSEKDHYRLQNEKILHEHIFPAYENLAAALTDLLGSGTNENGLCYFPEGKQYYEYLLAYNTGASESVKTLENMISNERVKVLQESSDLTTENPELWELASEATLTPTDSATTLNHLKEVMLDDFPAPPETSYTVSYIDDCVADYLAPAFYVIAPIDDYSHNSIYINETTDTTNISYFTTLAHEGFPGHLYQTVMTYESGIEPVRSILNYSGFVEGWATYVEFQSYHYAGLDDDVATILELNQDATLSLYASTDIGIHYEGWTLEDTKKFWNNYGITNDDAIESIFELIVEEPTHYLKYYIGFLKFEELKKETSLKNIKNYNDKSFHQAVLSIGPAPFDIVDKYLPAYYEYIE